jgi:hypothetical protein
MLLFSSILIAMGWVRKLFAVQPLNDKKPGGEPGFSASPRKLAGISRR